MNKEKTKISAQVVADSLSPQGDRLTSLLITFPRIILSELLTHRMLSKNTSSSRAIPFKKMVESVQNDPFIPIAWQKHHSGMQGTEYWDVSIIEEIGGFDYTNIPAKWLRARDTAINMAETLHDSPIGITKQLCNRLLEPFMWTTMLITGSKEGWDNFFELRCPRYYGVYKSQKELLVTNVEERIKPFSERPNESQAEIHIQVLAEKIYDAVNESFHTQILPTMWHVPFRKKINELYPEVENDSEDIVKISVSMAARASYTVVGTEKILTKEEHISLHDRLLTQDPPHSSPMEHCAQAMNSEQYDRFLKGDINFEVGYHTNELNSKDKRGWCRNFKGFIPYRHIIETEKYGDI